MQRLHPLLNTRWRNTLVAAAAGAAAGWAISWSLPRPECNGGCPPARDPVPIALALGGVAAYGAWFGSAGRK